MSAPAKYDSIDVLREDGHSLRCKQQQNNAPASASLSRNTRDASLAVPSKGSDKDSYVGYDDSDLTDKLPPATSGKVTVKISGINVWALRSPIDEPFCFSQGWVSERAATLVEIVTDDGLSGWGEALCQGLQPPEVAAAAIRHAFAPMLIGQDPQLPEVHWHAMYNKSRDFGLKGAVIGAISAIDIALWDIVGKVQHKPVHALLGGAFRREVQAYATGFYLIRGRGD